MKDDNIRRYGFARVGIAVPLVKVADPQYNAEQIISLIKEAEKRGVNVAVFPELSVTSYTAADLFQQEILLEESQTALYRILLETKNCYVLTALGMPVPCDNQLFNCAVLIQHGQILGIVPKTYIPNNKEFYEKRWFSSARSLKSNEIKFIYDKVPMGTDILFRASNFPKMVVGVEICEDAWVPIPPSAYQALAGATLHLNLSASDAVIGKADYRRSLISQHSASFISAYAYCSSGVGESTTDMVFDGHGIIAENGAILAESQRFSRANQLVTRDIDFDRLIFDRRQITSYSDNVQELDRKFRIVEFDIMELKGSSLERNLPANVFIPTDPSKRDEVCKEIFSIQTAALAKRLETSKTNKIVVGISGGLDSTLALLTAVKTFDILGYDRKNILALTMPGFGTTDRTKNNAIELCKALGVSLGEIDIKPGCNQQFQDLEQDPEKQDVVFQNIQARYRTALLFNKGNQIKALTFGTGDLSEIAAGWCTFGGDHISNYNDNPGVPKALIRYLVVWVADTQVAEEKPKAILYDIVDTPVSPELLKQAGAITQKTNEIIGPDDLRDFFLYHLVRWGSKPSKILFLAGKAFAGKYEKEEVFKWLKIFIARFFSNQWKRSCMPDGPKVGSVSLSPRGDWRMPSDAEVSAWLKDLEEEA